MQFFFCGLLVAATTYFLKLGHNNHGLIFTVVTLHLRAVETVGLLRAVETMGLLQVVHQWALYGPYDRLAKHGPITGRIMAVYGLELESSVHGPAVMGHR